MGVFSVRMADEGLRRLKERAGKGNVNAFVVNLIETALGLHEALERSPEGVMVTQELIVEVPVIDAKEALPATGGLVVEKGPMGSCGYWTGAKWCHRPAVKHVGAQPRCEQH
jgi:hypothetical protein